MASDLEGAVNSIIDIYRSYTKDLDCLDREGFENLMKDHASHFLADTCPSDTTVEECISHLFDDTDKDGDGCIHFNEFCSTVAMVAIHAHDHTHLPY
ncbi:protein S100-A7-like [Carettochelys insculpta]|uniref:protein S100-A7-like n=1 Tax=Carettochelys insculpta TaxID=44489 RepID=UPI003EC12FA6